MASAGKSMAKRRRIKVEKEEILLKCHKCNFEAFSAYRLKTHLLDDHPIKNEENELALQ